MSAEQVGRRLHSELTTALQALSGDWRSAAYLHRTLGVDRTLCQRVINAVIGPGGNATLSRAPGIEGLRAVAAGLRRAGAGEGAVCGVDAAIDQFQALLKSLGLSQSALTRKLTSPSALAGDGSSDQSTARQRSFLAAAEVFGHATEGCATIMAYRPRVDAPDRLESGYVRGFAGYRARPGSMPLVVAWGMDRDFLTQGGLRAIGGGEALGSSPGVLMLDHCTQPLPRITSRVTGLSRVLTIDEQETQRGRAIDVVVATHAPDSMKHPQLDNPAMLEVWCQTKVPTRRMVLDVWVHRTLAQAGLPSLGNYLMTPNVAHLRGRDWTMRVPSTSRLELLESGLANAATGAFPRHGQLTRSFFDSLGWDTSEMVGYRVEEEYPLVGAAHCIALDFEGRPNGVTVSDPQ
jgi:hypothetical protein